MSTAESDSRSTARGPLERVAEELLVRLGVDGVHARRAPWVEVHERLDAFITQQRDPVAELLRFPAVMSRSQLERSGYLKSFPNLLGCVAALHGSEASIRAAADVHEQGGDWTRALAASDLVLSPAACYPLYPLAASRGPVPQPGLLFDVAAECFRHEPARAASRMQSFRMREFVCIGTAAQALGFRDAWMQRAGQLAEQLALPHTIEPATDPFFGRVGQVMAVSQRQQALKFELLIGLASDAPPTACMSFNYHLDHFGSAWEMNHQTGGLAHTACVAFGMDRLVLALFCVHGLEPRRWPQSLRKALDLR
jgi:seryl-tRNA synthetase